MLTFADVIQPDDLQLDGIRALALAVLADATRKAQAGDVAALSWLESEDASPWALALGFPTWPPTMGRVTMRAALDGPGSRLGV